MLPPEKFKTVKQPEGSLVCVAAVAAMAVGRTLRYATHRMKRTYVKQHKKYYYKTRELLQFLGAHGIYAGAHWQVVNAKYAPGALFNNTEVIELKVPKEVPAVLCVKSKRYDNAEHQVFWDGYNVRDPDSKLPATTNIADYAVIDWVPLCYMDETKFK